MLCTSLLIWPEKPDDIFRNDVWETSTEIPCWWRFTTQICVVLLIGWSNFYTRHDQSEALLPRSGLWRVISMEFLRSFLRRHFVGKPFLASRNVVCFLRLLLIATNFKKNWIVHSFHGSYLKGSKQGSGKFTVMKCDFCHALQISCCGKYISHLKTVIIVRTIVTQVTHAISVIINLVSSGV